jgi:hypothetical protein
MAAAAMSTLGDLGVFVPEQLHAEQPPGGPVAGDADGDAVAAGIVGLVIIGGGLDCDRVEPGRGGFVVAQPGTGGGLVEDLDDLGVRLPANSRFPPSAFSPATRPCLCAVVPSGRCVSPSRRW